MGSATKGGALTGQDTVNYKGAGGFVGGQVLPG
jgi:hypothetical protein